MARLTTMGELAASIAHEINQPLAAVVASGNAALRWMAHAPPNLEETRDSIRAILNEGYRASEVTGRIRSLLKHSEPEYVELDINDAIRDVLELTVSCAAKPRTWSSKRSCLRRCHRRWATESSCNR